ncbi:MAG: DUF7065 domain-containing protein [Candidatus Helarchaeota archaeon]
MITDQDEHLHQPQSVPLWRESYYFNVMDPENNIFSVATMGYMPYEQESHYFAITYVDGHLFTHISFPKLKDKKEFKENPSDGIQSFTILKEHKEWEIEIKERRYRLSYKWKGRFPVYEYPGGWQTKNILEQAHYEQSGIVEGVFTFKDGKTRKISGYGHRDHSWGVRDWVQIDAWYWTSVQFQNGEIALNSWLNFVKGSYYTHGFISSAKENIPIRKIEVEAIEYDSNSAPKNSTFILIDQKGKEYRLTAETIYIIKLPQISKEGTAYIYETISKFELEGELGYGVAEYLKSERKK